MVSIEISKGVFDSLFLNLLMISNDFPLYFSIRLPARRTDDGGGGTASQQDDGNEGTGFPAAGSEGEVTNNTCTALSR